MIITVFYFLIGIYLLLSVIFAIGMTRFKDTKPSITYPTVSVLISCRNEELDLPACLESLINLDYPHDKLQIVLIDDNSTDKTLQLLKEVADEHPHIEAYSTSEFPSTHLEAKARGISHAASKATGNWYFITDADCIVPSTWIKHMLDGIDENTGSITGPMETLNPSFIGTLEKIAGFFKLAIGFGISGFGVPLFGLGPNMAIKKEAYDKAGGLEKSDFRIAEDMALFKMAHKLGYKSHYHFDQHTLIKLTPVRTFTQILSQQRRWLKGGLEGDFKDWFIFFFLFVYGLTFSFSYIYICIIFPIYGLFFSGIKLLAEIFAYAAVKRRFKSPGILRLIPLAYFYTLITYIWLPLSFIFSKDATWMGDGYVVKYD